LRADGASPEGALLATSYTESVTVLHPDVDETAAYVPAGPARRHIATLRNVGMTHRRIADLAGVSPRTVASILASDTPDDRAVARPHIVARLLRVQPEHGPSGTRPVSSSSTIRRLQALVVHGYPLPQLGARLGLSRAALSMLMGHPSVRLRRAVEVKRMYASLAFAPPTYASIYQRAAAARASRTARQNGWLGPLDWEDIEAGVAALWPDEAQGDSAVDDEHVDDVAIEQFLAGDDIALTRAEKLACAVRMVDQGVSRSMASTRLRMRWSAVDAAIDASRNGATSGVVSSRATSCDAERLAA